MKADLILSIDSLRGMLRKDGYYFRMYRGQQIVQRCPNRSGHVKTDGEKANQERFIERYRKKKTGIECRVKKQSINQIERMDDRDPPNLADT